MERLSLADVPPPQGPGGQNVQAQAPVLPVSAPQLPAQMFTTAAQLLDLTDSEPLLHTTQTVVIKPMRVRD